MSTVRHDEVLWCPDPGEVGAANLTHYLRWLAKHGGPVTDRYQDLWEWSVTDLPRFWQSIWEYFDVVAERSGDTPLADTAMPGAQWFPGARLNFAENALRRAAPDRPALVSLREDRAAESMTWAELSRQVAALAASLRKLGVARGDRVVAYLPNCPAAIVGLLACASVGAVWASCGPDFGTLGVLQRFQQLEPRVLLAADGYRFNGRDFDRADEIRDIAAGLPSLVATVVVPWLHDDGPLPAVPGAISWDSATADESDHDFEQVPFEHPLWILFSSGTTGRPKGIVHGHGGILLEHLKLHALMNDIRAGDRVLFVSSTTWMMWNLLASVLLVGATPVLFDGSPTYPRPDALWSVAAEQRITLLGAGAGYFHACLKEELRPAADHDLSALRAVLSTGSPLSTDGFHWISASIGDVWVNSSSGGTDVCSSFVGGCCLLPVHAGRLQARALGVAAAAYDESGRPVVGARGELVITSPMPSMPVAFWDDPDGERYRSAYFERFPGVWRHGDFVEVAADGSCVISGRSDATLNRRGVRMGSAEIYAAVEAVPGVAESLVIGVERPEGDYYMPLFVATVAGTAVDDELVAEIIRRVRELLSPRHVPDEIVGVRAIPHTRTGKKLEVPVKRLYQGARLGAEIDLGSVDDADLMRDYAERAGRWLAAHGVE
ncbi:acetoacetyl-CoA synthetase [Mycobacteroides immunogenum]|uniref:Acetoacetyl-CoA synthetase n=1 Tax=Mycobacteroides immunogenum TaxID=83262 RepID=A0A179V669_9MYCO|nr:acetoacetate--CoA ligase [Mycobacteroides immunogenum]OAT66592.1 acetoacetyl-CoA synthetase [Mycobacteroides immunogenum]